MLQLVVWATDTKDTTKISARTLIVELIDIDDNLPSFRKSIYASCPVDVSLLVFDLCSELPYDLSLGENFVFTGTECKAVTSLKCSLFHIKVHFLKFVYE